MAFIVGALAAMYFEEVQLLYAGMLWTGGMSLISLYTYFKIEYPKLKQG
jgi:hypothetical protein